MHSIDILLPTYNGGHYLESLLDSIIKQVMNSWRIIIRDDASTDNTVQIIKKYAEKYPDKIKLIENKGKRVGFLNNYANLLEMSDADYIMFCDQDDIWCPDKIKKSINKIFEMEKNFGADIPLLVHSNLTVVDENLKNIDKSFWKFRNLNPKKGSSLNRLLVQNIVSGCTVLMNKKLKELAAPLPDDAVVHDWWLSLIAIVFGKLDYIDEALILYRQHSNNVMGAKRFNLSYVIEQFLKERDKIKKGLILTQKQAKAFAEKFHGQLCDYDYQLISLYADLYNKSFLEKRWILLKNGFFKNGLLRNIGLFILI